MRRSLLVVVVLLGLTLGGAGCGSDCTASCEEPDQSLRFTGTLLAVDGEDTVWDGPDGEVDIRVSANVDSLDVGMRYRVTPSRDPDSGELSTAVNPECSCGLNITHEDGAPIDTGWWAEANRNTPIAEAAFVLLAIPVLTIAAVTMHRTVRR